MTKCNEDPSGTISRDIGAMPSSRTDAPSLFVAFHARQPFSTTSRHDLGAVTEVHLRRGTVRETIRTQTAGKHTLVLTFPDPCMSGMHATLRRRGREWWVEDAGSKNGTWLNGERVDSARAWNRELLEVGDTFLLLRTNLPQSTSSDQSTPDPGSATALTTLSPTLHAAFGKLRDVAASSIPVHVRGESGSGKELVSREVHRISGRSGAFVAVNCGALPTGLVESELFGFKKGSFSGATEDRVGLIRAAHGGTLFLDEIGDLALPSQAALLRVLQERSVLPLGTASPVDVDFRLVSATHRDLESLVSRGKLRDDLLARLSGFRIDLPRLADRLQDLGILVAQIVQGAVSSDSLSFTPEAVRALFAHSWPQNIRELRRRLSVAVVLAKGAAIKSAHLFESDGGESARPVRSSSATAAIAAPSIGPSDVARRDEIVALLREHGGNVTAVARAMGKARVQVQRWIRRYGIDRRSV